ncbi:ATP-dependent DNA helicase PIF1 [Metarhizium brunneum]|uniref:ATP-dependent DNA helicase n=1 Tax=Metarhizium brunneum TaxID=500148 RepID=A0A7D5Z795_9HYPO|nr:ATP-dependent DNA helicase PIF1 [Metarhizium brunneum]
MSLVKLKRKGKRPATWGELELDSVWPLSQMWVQALRRPGRHAVVCLDGYLCMDFGEEEELYHRRAAVQHLAIFVPWESFLSETSGDINTIWERQKQGLARRVSFLVDNVQLLRRSAEDVKRDARQWAAMSGETDPMADVTESGMADGDDELGIGYRSDNIGNAARLIDVFRNAVGSGQITTGSKEISTMVQELCRFQLASLCSTDDLGATMVIERRPRTLGLRGHPSSGAEIPRQEQVRSIKSQQISASKERERMIQGVQSLGSNNTTGHSRAAYSVLHGFGEDDISITAADSETVAGATGPSTSIRFGPATSFLEAGRQFAVSFTLNQRQSIALRLICRQLDRVRRDERGTSQPCQFVGGEGGTGKSQVIEAIAALFASKGISHRLLVTATSGTAAAQVNGITIHSACNLSKGISRTSLYTHVDGIRSSSSGDLYIDGQARMDWHEKWLLIVDKVSMLGARTLHAANKQLCKLRGCMEDFSGIPIIVFCGDFHQFRPI